MIQIDMEMPDCCGNCPCFHFENPMYCRARTDVHQRVVALYHGPRPNWCPLQEVPTANAGCNMDLISREAAIDRLNATPPGNWSKARYTRELWDVPSVEAVPLEPLAKFIFENFDPRVDCKTCKTNNPNHDSMDCIYDGCPHMTEGQILEDPKKWMEETNAPKINAMPVVHGKWIDKPNPRWPAYDIRYCSVCEWNINKSKLRAKDNWSFCPNCGAKMDLEEQTERD